MTDITWDIEGSGLLDDTAIDYTSSPYKLKDSFKVHCIVVEKHETGEIFAFYDGSKIALDGTRYEVQDEIEGNNYTYTLEDYEPVEYIHYQLDEFPSFINKVKPKKVVGHNTINYDHLVMKLYAGMDYFIADDLDQDDNWAGHYVTIEDTLVISKTLNPDRWGGHSLDNLAKLAGKEQKSEFRKHIPVKNRFKTFAPDMLHYNIFDVKSNTAVYHYLESLKGKTPEMWDGPILLEKQVAEIVTRQSHRGFAFNKDLAEEAVEELDGLMKERRERVDPLLPPRKATKAFLDYHTPSSSQVLITEECFPKAILNKNTGLPSANLAKFVMKHDGEIDLDNRVIRLKGKEYDLGEYQENHPLSGKVVFETRRLATHFENWLKKHEGKVNKSLTKAKIYGKVYSLPMELEPIKTEMVANIEDTTHIKGWLVELGWNPTEWAMRDITLKTGTKIKRNKEELETAITRYVEETLESPFWKHRCSHLGANRRNLRSKIEKKCEKYGCKVLTTPKFTIGQDKELCPSLEAMSEKFPYAKDIVEYLTYRHRRNTILGGNIGWDEVDEAEKGYLANIREDGRIPTPADTQGTPTARMKHKVVSNVPRASSLYGAKLRELFGAGRGCYQIGWDFPSLEARMEAHRCWQYDDEDKSYCKSLLAKGENDVHNKTAKSISEILKSEFTRSNAKSVKYACVPVDNSLVLTKEGFKSYENLYKGQEVLSFNLETKEYEWDIIKELFFYKDAEVIPLSTRSLKLESTEDHTWVGYKRVEKDRQKVTIDCEFSTGDINTEHSILHAAKYKERSSILPHEAALVAWLLSDGYYSWSELSETTSSSKGKRKGIIGRITQDVKKYTKELEEVLEKNSAPYIKDKDGTIRTYRIKSPWLRDFMDRVVGCRKQKHEVNWEEWVLKLDEEGLKEFFHHFWLADGHSSHSSKSLVITQNSGNIANAVRLVGNLLGKRSYRNFKTPKCEVITFSDTSHTTCQRLKKGSKVVKDVFCIFTTNGNFVMNQEDFITITGNCTYGASIKRVADTIGCDLKTGEIVFKAFWEAAKPLALFKAGIEKSWEYKWNKKYIKALDGRYISTRSKHSLVNSQLQSDGSLCAKQTIVYHDRLLRDEGLLVDLFKDDWKNSSYCQQMIVYHDESQLEATRDTLTLKSFKTEEEALKFKKTDTKIWSSIKEKKGKYFIGYSRAGELVTKAVQMTVDKFKLNVPLCGKELEYDIGLNWKDCH